MAFFTKEDARRAARQYVVFDHARTLRESVKQASAHEKFDVFLSHSSKDAELIRGVKLLLEGMHLKVYVDWVEDAQLDRSHVTPETAATLRGRMQQCNSLIYAATENSSSSRWMPWELGYFDGLRNQNVAIMPLTDRPSDSFKGLEYLGLYPLVGKDDYGSEVWVKRSNHLKSKFSSFVAGRPSWIY